MSEWNLSPSSTDMPSLKTPCPVGCVAGFHTVQLVVHDAAALAGGATSATAPSAATGRTASRVRSLLPGRGPLGRTNLRRTAFSLFPSIFMIKPPGSDGAPRPAPCCYCGRYHRGKHPYTGWGVFDG